MMNIVPLGLLTYLIVNLTNNHVKLKILNGKRIIGRTTVNNKIQEIRAQIISCLLYRIQIKGSWRLDLIVAEFGDDFSRRLLVASAPAAPKRGAPFGGSTGGVGGAEARRPGGAASLIFQHAVLSVGLGPVHGLLHVVLHAQPLLVAHGDAALPPLVVKSPLGWIAESLFCLLQKYKIE